MGCDIHLHVEYKNKNQKSWDKSWQTLAFDGLYISRDYALFTLMADVRNYDDVTPVAYAQGVPTDMHWGTKGKYVLHVDSKNSNREGSCSLEFAEKWINTGQSHVVNKECVKTDEEVKEGDFISSPDWHSASYMDIKEVRAVNKRLPYCNPSFKAVIGAMGALERSGYETRIVFWFDN